MISGQIFEDKVTLFTEIESWIITFLFIIVTNQFQDETALRWVESSLRSSEYRPINIFINFYSGT